MEIQSPLLSVTIEEAQLYHMIRDHELDQMSAPGTGVLGSIGFMALGAVLSLVQPFAVSVQKVVSVSRVPLEVSDFIASLAFIGSLVLSLLCLIIFSIQARGKARLADRIRSRKTVTPTKIVDPVLSGTPLTGLDQGNLPLPVTSPLP